MSLFDPSAGHVLQPPAPLLHPADRVLRFRMLDAAKNVTSMVWSVVGSRNHDDVYVAQRTQMGMVKLSLHETGDWRLAYTEQWATGNLPSGTNRLLHRWSAPPDAVPGWKRAAAVRIPVSSLTDIQPAGRRRAISEWPAPKPDWGLRYDILLGEPAAPDLNILGVAGEVGRFSLTSGKTVGVVVMQEPIDATTAAQFDAYRRQLGTQEPLDAPKHTYWTWGQDLADGTPVLTDLGLPLR